MMARRCTAGIGIVWLIAGCAGSAAAPHATATTVPTAPSTSSPSLEPATTPTSPTTTSPSAATTTVVRGRSLDEFTPPTSVLDSFSFEMSMVDVEGDPFGLVSNGEFVGPDAVWCDAGNPAFVSSSMGVGTAIGDSFWFDDGFSSLTAKDRDNELDWLEFCPGAHEYWEHPVFLDRRFTSIVEGVGDPIAGFDTTVYALGSQSDDLIVDEGRVWLTEAGWPIRFEITGSLVGGVFTFFDRDGEMASEGDLSTEMVPFVVEVSLNGFDGAQVVRAPDGSETVGPLGEAVSSVPVTIPPSGELAAQMQDARSTACVRSGSLNDIIAGRDLEELRLSAVQISVVDGNLTQTTPGMAGGGIGAQVTTRVDGDDALLHSDLLFNHRAPIAALIEWIGFLPPEMAQDGELHISVADGTDEDSTEIAAWNGATITYSDGSTDDVSYHAYLAIPEPGLALGATADHQARSRLDDWLDAAFDAAIPMATAEFPIAVDLEALYEDLDETKSLACTLLATAWTAADAADPDTEAALDAFIDEVAIQHTLLAIEYVDVLGAHLDQPRVDWLRADNLDLETGLLAGDTTGTVLQFFSGLLTEAIYFSDPIAYR